MGKRNYTNSKAGVLASNGLIKGTPKTRDAGQRASLAALRRMRFFVLAALACGLALSTAWAQTGFGVLTGTAIDASTKAPVADTVVTVTSPALQGEQIVVTDSAGRYRVPKLPAGEYTVRFDGDGYKPYSRGKIAIRADVTIRFNAELLPEALTAEEVVVVESPPAVDVGSSQIGQNVDKEFFRRIPVAPPGGKGGAERSFESVASVAPGAQSDSFGTSIAGSTSPENSYLVNGISTNNTGFGINGTPLSIEFLEEIKVVTGGYLPEYGRSTGGIINAITKSGSNEFHGSAWVYYTPGFLEGARTQIPREGNTIFTDVKLSFLGDLGFDLGGPIIKDKLWFYSGFQASRTVFNIDRQLFTRQVDAAGAPITDPETGFTLTDAIPGTLKELSASSTLLQFIGRLSYAADQDNQVSLTGTFIPRFSGGGGTFPIDPELGRLTTIASDAAGNIDSIAKELNGSSLDLSVNWSSALDNKNILFDTTLAFHNEINTDRASDGTGASDISGLSAIPATSFTGRGTDPTRPDGPHSITDFETIPDPSVCFREVTDPVTAMTRNITLCPLDSITYNQGGAGFLQDQTLRRYTFNEVATFLAKGLGSHVIKVGFNSEYLVYNNTKTYSGGTALRERPNGTVQDFRQFGFLDGPDNNVSLGVIDNSVSSVLLGGFIQDSWNLLDKVTLNLGLRYDAQYMFGGNGDLALSLPNQWAPRAGVVWDPSGEGRAKVFGNFARFYESVPLNIADRVFSVNPQSRGLYNGEACDLVNIANPGVLETCTAPSNQIRVGGPTSPNQTWILTGTGLTPVDPDLEPQSQDELVLGGEYQVFDDARVGLSYTKRYINNVIEDMSLDDAVTYFLGNPGKGVATAFPEATRDYDAFTLYFDKSFTNNWLASASYTLSWLRGTYDGLFRPETNQLDPNINSTFDLASLLDNQEGPLSADRRHNLKLFGARSFDLTTTSRLQVGGAIRTRSGGPTNYLGAHPIYGNDESFLLQRGSGERLPWTGNVDSSLAYGFRLSEDSELTATIDIFNLLNFQGVGRTQQRYTQDSPAPVPGGDGADANGDGTPDALEGLLAEDGVTPVAVNPNFGNPSSYQAPRRVRFGLRLTY